ncbi:MAG TPA: HWE histidine kinase domain-containing protein [Caulobacteraceae bacterium]|nr:HWE histidine kinase domain-containing protein [Caulobacteraceae bacterium]
MPDIQSVAPDFRAVFESTPRPMLLLAADPPRYTILAVNKAHAQAFNTTPASLIGRGVLEVFGSHPPPQVQAFMDAIRTSMERVLETGRAHQMQTRPYPVRTAEGKTEERFWSAVNAPVRDASGRIIHIVDAVQDVTGEVLERRSEDARKLLMREVDHRARNTLTVVQSLLRLAHAESIDAFRGVLEGRIMALARAQTVLANLRWEGGSLAELIEGELSMIEPSRLRIEGPTVMLPAAFVQPMSMLVHELATNALKHGALSGCGGRLAVEWNVAPEADLTLTWAEECGSAVSPPTREGFGYQLIGQLAQQMSCRIERAWSPSGLTAQLKVSLPPAGVAE